MKKHLAALAVAALACGAFAQAGDTIGKVKASGAITMGVRDASGALSYALGGGKYGGFHYEVCQRIIASLEAAIGRKVEVRFQAVTPQDRIVLMQEGVVDIECGSTTNTAARQKDVSFALTTYVDEVRIAVKADSGITSIAQLDGKTVAATAGTLSVPLLRKLERVHRIRFKEVFGKDHADSFLLLASGRADAFLTGTQTLAGNIANARNPSRYRILDDALGVEPVAIMRRLERSAVGQRGWASIASSWAGTSTVSVMRSRSMASKVASGSNLGCSVTVQPACSAGKVWMLSPPTWNSGSVVRTMSPASSWCMSTLLAALQASACRLSSAPLGRPVEPDV